MKFAGGFLSPPLIGGIIPQSSRQNKRILSVFFTFVMNVFHFTTSILQSVAIHCPISPKKPFFLMALANFDLSVLLRAF